jgi:uncharacterized membrane protein HdeD (DUF308 family)
MISSMQIDKNVYSQNWRKFLFWGIALVILGMLAISAVMLTTFISVMVIGSVILIAGAIIVVDSCTHWRIKVTGFLLHLIMGLLYIAVGVMVLEDPLKGSISLTLLLGIFYLVIGSFRTMYAISHRAPRWGLGVLNGLVSLILGLLILSNWPASSLYIIGLFVGIDILFCGWVCIMSALAARKLAR